MTLSDETRERLLDAAGQVFAEKGYKAATVREIVDRAGVNIAGINYHFGNKERLYIEAVKHAHQCRIEQVPDPQWPATTSPAEKLKGFIRVMLDRVVQDESPSWHHQLIMREMVQPTAACVELVRDHIRPLAAVLMEILGELLPKDTSLQKRFLIGFSIVGQCLFYRTNKPVAALLVGEEEFRSFDSALLADHIAGFTLAALGHERPISKQGKKK